MPTFRLFRLLLLLALIAVSAAIGIGFLGALHPAFDTFSHFRAHLSAGLLALAVLWSFRCSRAPSLLFALIGFAGLFAAAPGLRMERTLPASSVPAYTLLQFNMRFDNPRREDVVAMVREIDADIVILNEYSRHWEATLPALGADYPYRWQCPEWQERGGSLIFSRFELQADGAYCHAYAAAGFVQAAIGDAKVTLGAVHMRWPWPASGPRQLAELEPVLRALPDDALVAGDFNAATWSHAVNRFAELGGLTVFTGIGPTWMLDLLPPGLARWIGLPIDNLMAKGRVRVLSARTLPPAGSDHLPILARFEVRPPS